MSTDSKIVDGSISCWRDVRPPVTNHAPSIWRDTFSTSSFNDQEQQKYAEAIEALKQEARGLLMAKITPLKQMIFIDTLERLGVAYHFEIEIEEILQQIHNRTQYGDCDLFTTSLQFRLLRQHQLHVSCDVFDKFVDKHTGKFDESLSSDAEGILSLYEAAHVLFHDEEILEEAAKFSIHHLRRMEAELESPIIEKVKRALEHPLHRDIPIVYARRFISIYKKDRSRDEILLKLAKFNFNFLQNLYKEELFQVNRWWNKFDMQSKLPFTREPVVEAYVWGVGYHYEPQYSYVRIGLAKVFQIITQMDDTYDNYATVNEAQLFTEVLDRWNTDEVDRLPDYMKILYHFIMSTFEDYERDAVSHGKGIAPPYFKELLQQLGRAYNQELKWVMERKLPSFQDYLKNSEKTGCIFLLFASIIPGLESVTQETIDWMKSEPKFGVSTVQLGRYSNDICSHQRESKEGKILTVVDCYMKQYGVSKQEALSKFEELIEEAWKDINKEWVTTTSFAPKEITVTFLNYARICGACYNANKGDDGYTDPKTFKDDIAALFLHPIVI